MDLVEKSRVFGCVFLLVVLSVAVAGLYWFFQMMQTESKNRYLLRNLVEWSVDELDLHPGLKFPDLPAETRDRMSRSRQFRPQLKGETIMDYWGEPVRFEVLPGGQEFEWRSAGKDREFGTEDDRYARGKAGKVLTAPI